MTRSQLKLNSCRFLNGPWGGELKMTVSQKRIEDDSFAKTIMVSSSLRDHQHPQGICNTLPVDPRFFLKQGRLHPLTLPQLTTAPSSTPAAAAVFLLACRHQFRALTPHLLAPTGSDSNKQLYLQAGLGISRIHHIQRPAATKNIVYTNEPRHEGGACC